MDGGGVFPGLQSGRMYLSTTCWLFTTFRLGLCDGGSSLSGWVDLKSSRRHTSEHVCEGFLESCNRMEELPWINWFVFCCSDKHHNPKQLGEEGVSFDLPLPGDSLSLMEVRSGT